MKKIPVFFALTLASLAILFFAISSLVNKGYTLAGSVTMITIIILGCIGLFFAVRNP